MLATKIDFLEPSHAQRSFARCRKEVRIWTRQELGEHLQDECEISRCRVIQNLIASLQAKAAPTASRPGRDIAKAQSHASGPFTKKRKRHDKEETALSDDIEKRAKKSKHERLAVDASAVPSTFETRSKKVQTISEPPLSKTKNMPTSQASPAKSLKEPRNDVEEKVVAPPMYKDDREESRQDEEACESSDDEHTPEPLVHETTINVGKTSPVMKRGHSVYVPDGETKEQRDARTVFMGNVPMEVAKSKVHRQIHCTNPILTL